MYETISAWVHMDIFILGAKTHFKDPDVYVGMFVFICSWLHIPLCPCISEGEEWLQVFQLLFLGECTEFQWRVCCSVVLWNGDYAGAPCWGELGFLDSLVSLDKIVTNRFSQLDAMLRMFCSHVETPVCDSFCTSNLSLQIPPLRKSFENVPLERRLCPLAH